MGNRVAYLSSAFALLLLVFIIVLQPVRAHAAPFNEKMIKRLCDRQAKLGSRLPIQLVPPSLCESAPEEPTLSLSATPSTITAGGTSNLAWTSTNASSCTASAGWSGAKNTSGNQNVTPESTTTYTLSCTGSGGSVTESVTVTVNPVTPQTGTLVVRKVVVRDDGRDNATSTFSFQVNDGSAVAFESDGENSLTVNAGTYTVTEPAVSGFTTSYDNCASVDISNGETETCTITNNDTAIEPTTGHLIVNKITVPEGDTTVFDITASGDGTITGGGASTVTDAASKDYEVTPGTYSVAEAAESGWVLIANTCTDISVSAGETENCTITNGKLPTLTVVKVVINDDDGEADVSDFPLFIDGNAVTSWATTTVATGTRVVSETNQEGYSATFSGDCDSNGNVTLAYGDVERCTITNDDDAQSPTPSLTFSANPTNVTPGAGSATSTLTWSSSNVTFCEASNGWVGARAVAGTEVVTPVATTTYQLDCGGVNGTTTQSVTVNFVPAPVVPSGKLLITEVMYDLSTSTTSPQGQETANEWVEIYNGTNSSIDLSGWFIGDASTTDALPDVDLPAGMYAFITGSSTTAGFWNIPNGTVVIVLSNPTIGNGLRNDGDGVRLIDAGDTTIDAVNWGFETGFFSPSANPSPTGDDFPGQSLGRIDETVDTNDASDWSRNDPPNPGQ